MKHIASELACGERKAVVGDKTGIPVALQGLPQWVVWMDGPIDTKTGKTKKRVLSAKLNNAKCNDSATWTTYEQAQAMLEVSHKWKAPLKGVAFALNKNGIVMLDVDHCIHDGIIDSWAYSILAAIDSYTELSPSDTGLHIIAYGAIPAGINRSGVEMYDQSKFMSVTGKHLSGTPTTMEYRQEQVNALYAEIAPEKRYVPGSLTCQLSDEDLLAKAKNGNGARFTKLWEGDISGYPSHSEADQALCGMLAYWTGNDEEMMDRLFRQSELYREKWERNDYRERTIKRALVSE